MPPHCAEMVGINPSNRCKYKAYSANTQQLRVINFYHTYIPFSPPSPIPHGFHGKARHLIADGEIKDVAHNVGGFAHGLDAVDAHRPAVVVLIEVGYAHILLQISQDASECQQLIDCGINLYIQKEQLTLLDEE